MSATAIFFSILGALLIGAISPGPSFVLVSRIAVTASRLDGLAAALGMGLGGAIFGTLALVGLTALLLQVEWLHFILKIVGGAYLVYLGVRMWQGASEPLASSEVVSFQGKSRFRSFVLALLTHQQSKGRCLLWQHFCCAAPGISSNVVTAHPPAIDLPHRSWMVRRRRIAILFQASTRHLSRLQELD
jgi:hypothetical protein